MRGTGGHDEVVVRQRGAVCQVHGALAHIDVGDLAQQGGHVALLPEQVPDGRRNGRGRQPGRGHLVEQGLEEVVVGLVHQGHIHRRAPQGAGGFEAAEPATDDDHARAKRGSRGSRHAAIIGEPGGDPAS